MESNTIGPEVDGSLSSVMGSSLRGVSLGGVSLGGVSLGGVSLVNVTAVGISRWPSETEWSICTHVLYVRLNNSILCGNCGCVVSVH